MRRRLLIGLTALGMVLGGWGMAWAQDSAQAPDGGSPATFFSERADPLATIQITAVTDKWTDYVEYSEPDDGFRYTLITVEITNVGSGAVPVNPFRMHLIDSWGQQLGIAYVTPASEDLTLLTEEAQLDAGKSGTYTLAYELPEDTDPMVFMWRPEGDQMVTIPIEGAPTGDVPTSSDSPFGTGRGGSATPVASPVAATSDVVTGDAGQTLTVAGRDGLALAEVAPPVIERGWDSYDDGWEPSTGLEYVLVSVDITNVSAEDLVVYRSDLSLVLNGGQDFNGALVQSNGDGTFEDDAKTMTIKPGETVTLQNVFAVSPNDVPAALLLYVDVHQVMIAIPS